MIKLEIKGHLSTKKGVKRQYEHGAVDNERR